MQSKTAFFLFLASSKEISAISNSFALFPGLLLNLPQVSHPFFAKSDALVARKILDQM